MIEKIYEVVRKEASKYNKKLSDEMIEGIIWEHTGYPDFWSEKDGNTPEECFRTQVRRFFKENITCINHSNRKAVFNSPDDLCDTCWTMWYTADYEKDMSPKKLVRMRQADLMRLWRKNGFPKNYKVQRNRAKHI